jgi:hypothetical protein
MEGPVSSGLDDEGQGVLNAENTEEERREKQKTAPKARSERRFFSKQSVAEIGVFV